MITQSIRGDNYREAFDLVCNSCGIRYVYQDSRNNCLKYAKERRMKIIKGNVHICAKCNRESFNVVKESE